MQSETCQITVIHADRIARAQREIPDRARVSALAAAFKLLSDPGRLKILLALAACELCVCDLAALLESTPSAISHQLRLLRTAGLVETRKQGKIVYYSIKDQAVPNLLAAGLGELEKGTFR